MLSILAVIAFILIMALIIAMEKHVDSCRENDRKFNSYTPGAAQSRNFAIFADFKIVKENKNNIVADIRFDGTLHRMTFPRCSAQATRRGLVVSMKFIETCNINSELYEKIFRKKQ